MALSCLAISVLGFMPTYFLAMAQGKFNAPPIIHLHGMLFFGWMLLFCTQTWLVARGGTLAHRSWGMLGIALASAMAFAVLSVVSYRVAQSASPGLPAEFGHAVRSFEWVSVSGILFFEGCFIAAILNIKNGEAHKRWMLLGTIGTLGAPIARWFLTFLAPPPDPNAPVYLLPNGQPAPAVPPAFVSIPPALIGDILWVIAMIYDWRTRGKVHPVYLIGGAIMLTIQLSIVPVSETPLWHGIASWLGTLAL
jgi:hypothetical protein